MGQADSTLKAAPLSSCDYSLQMYTSHTDPCLDRRVGTTVLCVSAPRDRLRLCYPPVHDQIIQVIESNLTGVITTHKK